MITSKQLDALYEIINAKQQNIEKYFDKLVKVFGNDSYNLFRPCHSLSYFLHLNLLTKMQRLITLFLLYEAFKNEGIKKNPFGSSMIDVFEKTNEQYQRKFLAELLIDNKRDRYAKLKIEILLEQSELFQQNYKNRQQIEALKKYFIENTPKISATSQNQIRNVVTDFNVKDRKQFPIQVPILRQNIKETELSSNSYGTNFLRPLPNFIQINPSELIWVSPGIIADVCWDNSIEKSRRIANLNQILKKAELQKVNSKETQQFLKSLQQHPYIIFELNHNPNTFVSITLKNPQIASDIIIRMSKTSYFKKYLQKFFFGCPLEVNTLEVMARLIEKCQLSQIIIDFFISQILKKCNEITPESSQRKIAKIISVFLMSMLKNKQARVNSFYNHLKDFILRYQTIEQVRSLGQFLSE